MNRFTTMLGLLTLVVIVAGAQTYPEVSIREIQEIPDSVLNTVNPNTNSPLLGDTVWVYGVVATAPRFQGGPPLWFTGDRWRFILKDPSESVFNHITLAAVDTAFFKDSVGLDLLAEGDSVLILGRITEFRGLTQLEPLRRTGGLQLVGTSTASLDPVTLPVSDFFNGIARIYNPAEKHESGFIRFENLTVIGVNGFEFTVADAQGNRIIVDDQSNQINFDGSTGVTPPTVGSRIDWVQGYIFTNSALDWTISPRFPADYQVGTIFPPSISQVDRTIDFPTKTDNISVEALIVDSDGTVATVKAEFYVNGAHHASVTGIAGADSVWTVTVPAVGVDSAFVNGYIVATDDDGNSSTFPNDTTSNRIFFFVLDRPPTIVEVQYNPYAGGSSYVGRTVTVDGIATSDRLDYGAVFVQDGAGKWTGIRINASADSSVRRGQHLTVTGLVAENFGLTILNNATFTENSSGNPLPDPVLVTTAAVKTGGPDAEAYESVLLRVENVYVVNLNEDAVSNSNFGEFGLSENVSLTTGLRVDDFARVMPYTNDTARTGQAGRIQLHKRDRFGGVVGVLDYSFSNFKLLPRDGADFSGYEDIFTSVERTNDVPSEYSLSQNYPNPFNPTTIIEYALGRESHVRLTVYNMMGQVVGRVVDEVQPAGAFRVTLGSNFFSRLSTGMYFYKIEAGDFIATKKMVFLK